MNSHWETGWKSET